MLCQMRLIGQFKLQFNMLSKLVCLLAALAILVQAIDQTCSLTQTCPSQSTCNLNNNYCICNPGFISNCNQPAQQLSANTITSTLTSGQTNYYYTNPTQLQKYIQFDYTVCPTNSNSVDLIFTLWGQTGTNTQYNSNNALVPPAQGEMENSCLYFTTPYIIFGTQPNGQSQMLILGITDNSAIPTTITISVSQRVVFVFLVYYYILIGLGIFVAVFLIVGGTIFLVRRRRLRAMGINQPNPSQAPQTNDISYFQIIMKQPLELLCLKRQTRVPGQSLSKYLVVLLSIFVFTFVFIFVYIFVFIFIRVFLRIIFIMLTFLVGLVFLVEFILLFHFDVPESFFHQYPFNL